MARFLVNIATLALVYIVARFTLGIVGIMPDHAAPDNVLATATAGAIGTQVLYWLLIGHTKAWGGIHRLNGLMTVVITAVSVVALMRYLGIYEPVAGTTGTNLLMLGLGFIVIAKVLTMLLLLLGVMGRVGTDPGGNPSQERVDEDV